jgi:hypothetical protein
LFGVIFPIGNWWMFFCDAQFGTFFLVILRLFLFLVLVFEAFLLGVSFFVRLGLFSGRRSG